MRINPSKTKVTLLLLLHTTILFAQSVPPSGGAQASNGARGAVATADPSVAQVFTTMAGRLVPRLRIDHKVPQTGIVDDIFVSNGQAVALGDPLFSVVQNTPGDLFRPAVVLSRLNGRVSNILVVNQEEVVAGTTAVTVIDATAMILEAAVSDLDAFALSPGIPVIGHSAEGDAYSGILTGISAEPDYDTGLFTARFSFAPTQTTRIGTFLLIDVPVAEVRGIFVDPESVVRRYGRNRIWTIDGDDQLRSVEVETGSVVEGRILIRSGLEPGMRYLTEPSGREQEGMAVADLLGTRG